MVGKKSQRTVTMEPKRTYLHESSDKCKCSDEQIVSIGTLEQLRRQLSMSQEALERVRSGLKLLAEPAASTKELGSGRTIEIEIDHAIANATKQFTEI